MTGLQHVAVIDIGKTNAKLALVDLDTLGEVAVLTRPNTVLAGPPYPHFDVEGHWAFVLDGLKRLHKAHGVDAISITTHGASAALLDKDGALASPILDYEHPGPDELGAEYDGLRPEFAETGSPRLPGGLNLGAQIFWQFRRDGDLRGRTRHVVTYPQYWGFRLTGVAATDVTSLGCHTDLWNPHKDAFSRLVETLDIADKMAPARHSADVLGPILPDVARFTGLSAQTPVATGIHDSNASLYPHIRARAEPFSVVSTGTWVVAMSVGGQAKTLDPARDTLINVNAEARPVPSARFMGGREYDLATQGVKVPSDDRAVQQVIREGIMLKPSLVPGTGPFPGSRSSWIGREPVVGSALREAAVSFYLASMTGVCLELVGHAGDIVVEGPFARNRAFLGFLAGASGSPVFASPSATGTSSGAALLMVESAGKVSYDRGQAVAPTEGASHYFRAWKDAVAGQSGL
jgi:sugar (pentulose or hexulose) kinase